MRPWRPSTATSSSVQVMYYQAVKADASQNGAAKAPGGQQGEK